MIKILSVIFLFAIVSAPGILLAETRVAFIVGNSAYENAPSLSNPVRDARLVGDTLVSLGFDVTRHQDLTRESFAKALGAFLKKSRDADVTFFYFAGHGMQYDGQNYLVGTDAELISELDIEGETIALNKVVELLERNSKAALIFVDACRDNPLATDFYRRNFSETRALNARGLARVRARIDGSMLVFAAAPGQVAYDGDEKNSPFATALARHLPTENTEILSLTKRIIGDVRDATDGRQSPIVTNDLTKEIFLREVALRPQSDGPSDLEFSRAAEAKVFEAAKKLNTPRAWAHYFDEFPGGHHFGTAIQLESRAFREALQARTTGRGAPDSRSVTVNRLRAEALEYLGLTRSERLALQSSLNRLGYNVGGVDGVIGPRSFEAIADFQRDRALTADGAIDRATLTALGVPARNGLSSSWFQYASVLGARYSRATISLIENDQRVHRLVEAHEGKLVNYGFYNDRLYAVVLISFGIAWEIAVQEAQRSGGHLVSIGTAEENDFVVDLFRFDGMFWEQMGDNRFAGPTIGLSNQSSASVGVTGWKWVTGEPLVYRNWFPGYPDGNTATRYVEFVRPPTGTSGPTTEWGWGDWFKAARSIVIEIP